MYIVLDKVECGSNVNDSLAAVAVFEIDNRAICTKDHSAFISVSKT